MIDARLRVRWNELRRGFSFLEVEDLAAAHFFDAEADAVANPVKDGPRFPTLKRKKRDPNKVAASGRRALFTRTGFVSPKSS